MIAAVCEPERDRMCNVIFNLSAKETVLVAKVGLALDVAIELAVFAASVAAVRVRVIVLIRVLVVVGSASTEAEVNAVVTAVSMFRSRLYLIFCNTAAALFAVLASGCSVGVFIPARRFCCDISLFQVRITSDSSEKSKSLYCRNWKRQKNVLSKKAAVSKRLWRCHTLQVTNSRDRKF